MALHASYIAICPYEISSVKCDPSTDKNFVDTCQRHLCFNNLSLKIFTKRVLFTCFYM